MGHGVTITCSHCSNSQQFMLGVGMLYESLENVMHIIHHTRRRTIKDVLENHAVHKTEYEHRLYHCAKCSGLFERFYVLIHYDRDQAYETLFKCQKCKKNIEPIDDSDKISQIACAKCGRKALKVVPSMLWD